MKECGAYQKRAVRRPEKAQSVLLWDESTALEAGTQDSPGPQTKRRHAAGSGRDVDREGRRYPPPRTLPQSLSLPSRVVFP